MKVRGKPHLLLFVSLPLILLLGGGKEGEKLTPSLILKKMSQAEKQMSTFTASFKEERSYAYDPTKERLSGKIYYKKPGRIRWDYLNPTKKEIVVTPKRAWIYLPDANQVQLIKFSGKTKFTSLPIGFGGPSPTVNRDYELNLLPRKDGLIPLELIPKKKTEASYYYRKIVIYLDPARWLPASRIELFEITGDATTFALENISLNKKIPSKLFSFKFPKGVEIIDYTK